MTKTDKKLLKVPVMTLQDITPGAFRNKALANRMPKSKPIASINDIIYWKDGFVERYGVVIAIRISLDHKWYYEYASIRLSDGYTETGGIREENIKVYEE